MNARLNATLNMPLAIPLDVKLMNMATTAMALGCALLVIAALVWWLLRLPLFALAGITVTGDVEHNNVVTLRANVTPKLNGNFFTVDLAQARKVFESVPWVRHAVVQREFPNRLRVHLVEHQPAAFWGPEGEGRMLNQQGEVFEANLGDLEDEDLPTLQGPDNQSAQVLAMYRALASVFKDLGLPMEGLELTARGSWRAHLGKRAVVEMGRGTPEELKARLQPFVQTLPSVASRNGRKVAALESADLRHENGYALRMRGITTVDPQQVKK
ncbi:MAG: hypothetical protein RLZZ484_650 [Pseudomonadota bacterium]